MAFNLAAVFIATLLYVSDSESVCVCVCVCCQHVLNKKWTGLLH